MTHRTDAELESMFRDTLRRRADDVVVPHDLVDRARPARRRRGWVVAAAGAAAAVVVVALAVQSLPRHPHQEQAVSAPSVAPAVDTDWRTEAWHGLQVSVPAGWGWGTEPIDLGQGPAWCGGPGASTIHGETGGVNTDPTKPYVGRPIMLSDACQLEVEPSTPQAPYVWLGAAVKPGTVDLGGGYVQQTVEVDGTTLTVATDDAALRQQILDSATTSECPATLTGPLPQARVYPGSMDGTITRAQMCVYQRDQEPDLVYAERLDGPHANAYADAAETDAGQEGVVGSSGPGDCDSADELAVVRLTVQPADQPATVHQTVVNLGCGWISTQTDRWHRLSDATRTTLTAGTGLPAVLHSLIGGLG